MKKNKWLILTGALLMSAGMWAQTPQQEARKNYNEGNRFFQAQQYDKAFVCYEKAAVAGHSGAQYNLGVLYMEGAGTTKDFGKALEWFEKAANQGEKDAQYNLVVMYQDGVGVEKDPEKAKYWTDKFNEKEQPKTAAKSSAPLLPQTILTENGEEVQETLERNPEFPGGEHGLMMFLRENVKYPVKAQENGTQGKPVVSFVVDKDGSVKEVKIAKSVHPLLDAEAIRVVKSMPKWNPALSRDGQPVRVRFSMPITFRLNFQ
jgi:protein TonB